METLTTNSDVCSAVVQAALDLAQEASQLQFAPPTACIYNPLQYAWQSHKQYIEKYGAGRKKVVFLGMNPGPFGMAQTGVPFGEIPAVRDWMGVSAAIEQPGYTHPKRPVQGFECPRSEVSGRRLWGLMQERFGSAEAFFAEHFVLNYCPLVFMEESSRNRTPNQLPRHEREQLFAVCDRHLQRVIRAMQPDWLIGIGAFASKRAAAAMASTATTAASAGAAAQHPRLATVLHPSPASPHANRGWAEQATAQLITAGVWT